jgi:hypothetical protein
MNGEINFRFQRWFFWFSDYHSQFPSVLSPNCWIWIPDFWYFYRIFLVQIHLIFRIRYKFLFSCVISDFRRTKTQKNVHIFNSVKERNLLAHLLHNHSTSAPNLPKILLCLEFDLPLLLFYKTLSIVKLENTNSRTKFSCFRYGCFKTGHRFLVQINNNQ